jgi:RNA polymerase sigma-70 factor, ECF subfamily
VAEGVTQLLARLAEGEPGAIDRLLPSVYGELRAMAAGILAGERAGHTLEATALVHEAYLKLVDQTQARWHDRAHFLAVAAEAMRRILVDHARGRARQKRGAGGRVCLDTALTLPAAEEIDLVALDEALGRLAGVSKDAARVVELRYFGGMTIREAAAVMGVSDSTVEREWRYARAWLHRALGEE